MVRRSVAGELTPTPDPAQRILVVEDEAEMRRLIERKLVAAGFQVETADSATRALDVLDWFGLPHLAIVDINMPGMNGLDFCATVQQYADLPVIMVTAVKEAATTITAIEKYAEDYIVKPFNLDELVARVQRVLRRIGNYSYVTDAVVPIDRRLAINFVRQQVIVDGNPVELTPTETKLLYILWRNAGQVVTNEFLISRIWPVQEVYEDLLRVHVHRLRQKMGSDGRRKKQYIVTERGRGYRFVINKEDGR
jgi:DNA-binding response OmpR family regulator